MNRRLFLAAALAGAAVPLLPSPAVARTNSFRENFADLPDGPLAEGQETWNFSPLGANAQPWVRDGYLSARNPEWFEGGCYRGVRLDSAVREVGARFVLGPASQVGGLLCLSIQMGSLAQTHPVIPTSPLHLTVDLDGWGLDVNAIPDLSVDHVTDGKFWRPLTPGTLYTISATLNRSQCTLRLPDGQTIVLYSPMFAKGGRYAYVEPFKAPGGGADLKSAAVVREWWAAA